MTDEESELRQARFYLEIYRTTAPLDPELRKRESVEAPEVFDSDLV